MRHLIAVIPVREMVAWANSGDSGGKEVRNALI